MRCNNWVVQPPGKRQEFLLGRGFKADAAYALSTNAIRCTGEIEMEVRAVEEPLFGGTYASVEVEYTCPFCKKDTRRPEGLPGRYDLNEWLNNILRIMP